MLVRRMPSCRCSAQIGEWWHYRHCCDAGRARGPSISACSPLTVKEGRRMGWDRSLRHSSDSFGRSWHHGRGVVQAQPVQEAVSTRYGWPTLPRSACTPSTLKACRRGLGSCVATGQEARRLQSVLWMERFSASSSRLERHPDHDPDKGRVRYVIVDLHSASGSRRHSAGRPDTRTANGDHRGGAAAISYITAGSVCP